MHSVLFFFFLVFLYFLLFFLSVLLQDRGGGVCQCVCAACIEESGGSFASTDIPPGDGASGWGGSQCTVIMDMICACTARCSTRLFCCTAPVWGLICALAPYRETPESTETAETEERNGWLYKWYRCSVSLCTLARCLPSVMHGARPSDVL